MKGINLESEVYEFSKVKHSNQIDDEGKPYFEAHILQVVSILHRITDNRDIICAGYLHDTIEDTDTTFEEIRDKFGKNVANLVLELTHEGNKEIGFSFPRLKSKNAILVKFADRLSNLSRMSGWSEKRQSHYLKKSKFWKE